MRLSRSCGSETRESVSLPITITRCTSPQRIILGFMVATGLFLFVMLLYLWRRGLWLSLAVTAGSLLAIHVIFRMVFQVILPRGTLWQQGLL